MQSRAIILILLLLASSAFGDSKTFSNTTDITDTYIYDESPTTNFSSDTGLMIANAFDAYFANALFTLETSAWDSIGVGQIITACSVYAYCYDYSFNSTVYSAFIKRPMVTSQSTYNIYSTGNNWGTAGAQDATDKGSDYDTVTTAGNGLYKFALDTAEVNAAYSGDSTYRAMLQWGAANLLVWFNSVNADATNRLKIVLYYEALATGPVNYRHGPDGVGQRHGPDGVSVRHSP